jgi:hypothetical protein
MTGTSTRTPRATRDENADGNARERWELFPQVRTRTPAGTHENTSGDTPRERGTPPLKGVPVPGHGNAQGRRPRERPPSAPGSHEPRRVRPVGVAPAVARGEQRPVGAGQRHRQSLRHRTGHPVRRWGRVN